MYSIEDKQGNKDMIKEILAHAKFGERLKMRNGQMAIMWNYFESPNAGHTYELIVDNIMIRSTIVDLDGFNVDGNTELDIVGKWDNELSVEDLKRLDEVKLDYCEQEGYTYAEDEWDELIGWRTKEEYADEICQAIAYGFEQGIKK